MRDTVSVLYCPFIQPFQSSSPSSSHFQHRVASGLQDRTPLRWLACAGSVIQEEEEHSRSTSTHHSCCFFATPRCMLLAGCTAMSHKVCLHICRCCCRVEGDHNSPRPSFFASSAAIFFSATLQASGWQPLLMCLLACANRWPCHK